MAVPPVHRPLAVPVRRLNSVDLPTFGLPIKATRNGRVKVSSFEAWTCVCMDWEHFFCHEWVQAREGWGGNADRQHMPGRRRTVQFAAIKNRVDGGRRHHMAPSPNIPLSLKLGMEENMHESGEKYSIIARALARLHDLFRPPCRASPPLNESSHPCFESQATSRACCSITTGTHHIAIAIVPSRAA